MTYERPKDIKIELVKSMTILSEEDDVLRKYSRSLLEQKKFRTQVLSHQDPAGTEMAYHAAGGRNVLASFEKLKKEVMDIHFASLCQDKEMRIVPVLSYECKSSNSESEIKFLSQHCKAKVNIVLELLKQPKSILSPSKPAGHFIRISVGKKIPTTEKLKESFDQFMNSGGLLIDFIFDTLWPILHKVKNDNETQNKKNRRNEPKHKNRKPNSEVPRACSGSDRAARNFENRNTGYFPRGGTQERKTESYNSHNRGDPIPRRNLPMNAARGPKSNFPRDNVANAHSYSDNRNSRKDMGPVGGSFGGQGHSFSSFPAYSHVQPYISQDVRHDSRGRRSKSQRGRGVGGRGYGGSEGTNWRGQNP